MDPTKGTSIFTEINIEVNGQSLHSNMRTSDLSPFFLVTSPTLTQISNLTTKITYLFGVNVQKYQSIEGVLKYPTQDNVCFKS